MSGWTALRGLLPCRELHIRGSATPDEARRRLADRVAPRRLLRRKDEQTVLPMEGTVDAAGFVLTPLTPSGPGHVGVARGRVADHSTGCVVQLRVVPRVGTWVGGSSYGAVSLALLARHAHGSWGDLSFLGNKLPPAGPPALLGLGLLFVCAVIGVGLRRDERFFAAQLHRVANPDGVSPGGGVRPSAATAASRWR